MGGWTPPDVRREGISSMICSKRVTGSVTLPLTGSVTLPLTGSVTLPKKIRHPYPIVTGPSVPSVPAFLQPPKFH